MISDFKGATIEATTEIYLRVIRVEQIDEDRNPEELEEDEDWSGWRAKLLMRHYDIPQTLTKTRNEGMRVERIAQRLR